MNSRTAIVTGGSRGIGRAIATRLAADGARVIICARGQDSLLETATEISRRGGIVSSIGLDLRLSDAPAELVRFTLETFGSIDIVVNNAGATKRGDFLELTDDDFMDGFALKFMGAVRLTRAAWPHLKAVSGSVINISGSGGRTPGPEFTIGGSVNAALLSFTKAMADVGIRDGVQVNAINPGMIRTDRLKARLKHASEEELVRTARISRIGEPEDVANLVAFITSAEGRYLQGALIDLDGGATKTI